MNSILRICSAAVPIVAIASCSGGSETAGSLGSANAREVIAREVVRELPQLYRAFDLLLDVIRLYEADSSSVVPDPQGLSFSTGPTGTVDVIHAPPGAEQSLSMVFVFSDRDGPIDPGFMAPRSLGEVFAFVKQHADLSQVDAEWSIQSSGNAAIVGAGILQDLEPSVPAIGIPRGRVVNEATDTAISVSGLACAEGGLVGAQLLGRFSSPVARLFDGAPDSLASRFSFCGACGQACGPSVAEGEAEFALFESIFFLLDQSSGAVTRVSG